MSFKSLGKGIVASAILLGTSLMLTDCTPKITEEQKLKLQDLYRQEQQLKTDLSNVNSEIKKIESELDARNAELKKCEDEKKFVEDKLNSWPNVWPDYNPNEGEEEESEEG